MNRWCFILASFLIISFYGRAQEDSAKAKLSLQGYIKNMPSVSFQNELKKAQFLYLFHNRLNFSLDLPKNFTIKAEIRNRFFTGNQVSNDSAFGKALDQDAGLADLSFVPLNRKSAVINSNIDRLYFNWYNNKWDVTVGRQRINWGINTVWTPNDIFNSFNYLDFDYEERPGSDAIRLQYTFKAMTTLQAAWKIGKNKKENIAALLYKFNRKEYDWQIMSGIYKEDIVIGAGWAGNLKNAGFKGELSYFHPQKNFFDTTGVTSFSAGLDYLFSNGWYLLASYLFNSAGVNKIPDDYTIILAAPSAKNLYPFKHSVFLQGTKQLTPLFTGGLSIIYSPGGSNFLVLFPTLSYSLAENWDLGFFSQHFWGKQNSYHSFGNSFYLRLKWSF